AQRFSRPPHSTTLPPLRTKQFNQCGQIEPMYVAWLFSKAERASGVTESSTLAKLEFAKMWKKNAKNVKGWGKLGLRGSTGV
ncbi:MAG: hypothetical protein KUG61_08410, partial [Parvibaculaceae bacterium]|nr:hypothetical protein [Parvibaculaceae bacterium]